MGEETDGTKEKEKLQELDIALPKEETGATGRKTAPDNAEAPGGAAREADEFGLPIQSARRRQYPESDESESADEEPVEGGLAKDNENDLKDEDAQNERAEEAIINDMKAVRSEPAPAPDAGQSGGKDVGLVDVPHEDKNAAKYDNDNDKALDELDLKDQHHNDGTTERLPETSPTRQDDAGPSDPAPTSPTSKRKSQPISEWSHQQLASVPLQNEDDEAKENEEDEWQEMPALATYRQYDDWGKVTAKSYDEVDDAEVYGYNGLGGAGRGYTRVQIDEDAQSATSLDENTAYLFRGDGMAHNALDDEEEQRDAVGQMQATKDLLTDGQKIAYVGVVRLSMAKMLDSVNALERTKSSKKFVDIGTEQMKKWAQKIMVRLYAHMDINANEQVMVEQLAEHGVLPSDMTPTLMINARVKNPQTTQDTKSETASSARPSLQPSRPSSKVDRALSEAGANTTSSPSTSAEPLSSDLSSSTPSLESPPPTYEEASAGDLTVKDPMDFEKAKSIDLDIRWTVLCDLFLLLIVDSDYDARSRTLLEHVGQALSVEWQEICRFEKRVSDALEMQEQAEKENWNEEEHLTNRRKQAFRKRLMIMGLCTVGGGLVIGLSAGLLAPVIGAGLAAGFTTIGVSGTSAFLGGAGGAAIIGTTGVLTGGTIGVRAGERRTGAVKTFEYRPLHNNKRVNLIVSVSGWMTGKVDDVRLPFSTVDPVMGDIYSVHWEPEMLQSTGQTINILATEALTQTIQQILGSTVLTALMAGLSLPLILTKLSYLIDNPWSVSLARADAAGLILADSIMDRNLGARPITLVGYSLGSRVIFSCLRELAMKGAFGLVQNAYMFGTPVVAKKEEYLRARTVVSGRFVNGYATNDWILGYLFRATAGGIMRVAGLNTIEIPGIENMNVTDIVPGHMAYRGKMPVLLRECGWLVESDEFSEIEDPDPENHEARQRELITEIEAARRELDGAEKKKGLKGFFSRRKEKQATKHDWETYDPDRVAASGEIKDPEKVVADNSNVMFDVDAIEREALRLALEGEDMEEIKAHMQIREIQSTMPMMRVSSMPSPAYNANRSTASLPNDSNGAKGNITPAKSDAGRSRPPNGNDWGGWDTPDDNVALSFEHDDARPPLRSPAPSYSRSPSRASPARSPALSPRADSYSAAPSPAMSPQPQSYGARPPLRGAATEPFGSNMASEDRQTIREAGVGSDIWADEEEDFGKEKEVSMTFD